MSRVLKPADLHRAYKDWAALPRVPVTRLCPCRFLDPGQMSLHNRKALRIERRFAFDAMANVLRHAFRIVCKAYDRARQMIEHMFHHEYAPDQIVDNRLIHSVSPMCGNRNSNQGCEGDATRAGGHAAGTGEGGAA